MGTTEKTPKDWKFYAQLGVLVSGIGGGFAANKDLSERVIRLEMQSQHRTEQMQQIRETVKELREEIRKLHEDMVAKKIVNTVALDYSNTASRGYRISK